MNFLLWGLTLGTLGKVILGAAVLRVHTHILREHKIDNIVLKSIKKEQFVTLLGLTLIVVGYVLEVYFYAGAGDMLTCLGAECAASLEAALRD